MKYIYLIKTNIEINIPYKTIYKIIKLLYGNYDWGIFSFSLNINTSKWRQLGLKTKKISNKLNR